MGHDLGSGETAGIVSAANWNNFGSSAAINQAVVDSTGGSTSVLVSWNSAGSYGSFAVPNTPDAGINKVYSGGIFGHASPEASVSISGIPYSSYYVIVYAAGDGPDQTDLLGITDGSTTYYYKNGAGYAGDGALMPTVTSLVLANSTNPGTPTVGVGQYEVFTSTSSSFSFNTIGSIEGTLSNQIFGFQITTVSPFGGGGGAPEPGTIALISAGLAGFVGLRRARRK
jgi:hypothetical protein